jgi:hypothetical protein
MSWMTTSRAVESGFVAALAGALLASCGGGGSARDLEVTMHLDAVAIASTEVQLTWTPHPGITHYAIHVNRAFAFDGYWSSASPAYKFTQLLPQTSYCYRIVAIQDFWPVASVAVGRSNEACVGTPRDLPPSAPADVSATPVSPAGIRLNWRAATDDFGVTAYRVYRDGRPVATNTGAIEYIDTGLYPSSSYCYLVAAIDAVGHETKSVVPVCATTLEDVTPPTPPGSLAAVSTSATEVRLSWTAATDDGLLAGYRIYRDGARIADVPGLARTDAGLATDTRYCYDVTAYDAAGNESEARTACVIAGWKQRALDWGLYSPASPALAVDAAGAIRVAYCKDVLTAEGRRVYRLTSMMPDAQPQDLGAQGESICSGPDIAHDSLLQPHISYYGQDYAVMHWAGYPETVSPASTTFSATAIAIDAADRVHLAYVTSLRDRDIVYMVKEGGGWSSRVIDRIGDCFQPSYYPAEADLAVERSGAAHLAYLAPAGDGTCEVHHASNRNGEWVIEKVDSSPGGAGPPAVGVTREGAIHIGYALYGSDGVAEFRVATRAASAWATSVVSSGMDAKREASLAVGPAGATHVSWVAAGGAVHYATDESGGWREITLQEQGHYGRPSVAIDPGGRVHIAYRSGAGQLMYATNKLGLAQ